MTKALVIDDNRLSADVLCNMLDVLDVKTQAAYGPRAALQVLEAIKPDIVFLDLNMPGVNGFEVLRYIKREPATMDIPVVVVTSDDQPETAAEARREGALDLIVKPASIETLQNVLTKAHLEFH